MGQLRNKTGTDFEKSIPKSFIRKPVSPKMVWDGEGRNNMKKIIQSNFDEKSFKLNFSESKLGKYDCIEKKTGLKYEIKKYFKTQLKEWTLYSEPYFKMSSKKNLSLINQKDYNDFVKRFFEHNSKNGFFDRVVKSMISETNGIYLKDGILNMEDLEFTTTIVPNQWKGYDRITIMVRLR